MNQPEPPAPPGATTPDRPAANPPGDSKAASPRADSLLRSALLTGAVAAVAAALLNLPLRSPLDAYFNSATAVLGALVAAVAAGALWARLHRRERGLYVFRATLAAAIVLAVAGSALAQLVVSGAIAYVAPLATVTLGLIAVLVPSAAMARLSGSLPLTAACVLAALALGAGLATQRDTRVASLTLPPVAASSPASSAPTASSPAVIAASATETATPPAASPTAATQAAGPTAATPPSPTTATGAGATPAPPAPPTVTATGAAAAPASTTGSAPASAQQASGSVRSAGSYDGVQFAVGAGSKATFTVGEKLVQLPLPNDAVLTTSGLSGEVFLDGRPSTIRINLHSLTSDQEFRDLYVRTQMFPGQPTATLTVPGIDGVPDGLASGKEVSLTVAGMLNIKARDFPIEFDIVARDDGAVIYIVGKTTFTWADLGLSVPRARSVTSVDNEVRVEVLLAVRPS
jgi:hypothetical protein